MAENGGRTNKRRRKRAATRKGRGVRGAYTKLQIRVEGIRIGVANNKSV
jgi:hypothetical protein